MTKLAQIRVRPKKNKPTTPCAVQLTAMLACWAAAGSSEMQDSACADAAKALHDCMRLAPPKRRVHKPTINYHLSRLGKNLLPK